MIIFFLKLYYHDNSILYFLFFQVYLILIIVNVFTRTINVCRIDFVMPKLYRQSKILLKI